MVVTRSSLNTDVSLYPEIFYRVNNENEHHHDHQYKTGFNFLKGKFSTEGDCVEGGFYYTTLKYLHIYKNIGTCIREIRIPKNANIVKLKYKYRADKIILGKKYNKNSKL